MESSKAKSGGIGFCGLLTIAFIVLKLTHYIDWSWWLVLSPILLLIAMQILCLIGIVFFAIWCLGRKKK